MQQALFKCETPRLELKSSQSFLAIKRCQRTKIRKVIKLARSSKKSGRISATIAVKLLKVPFEVPHGCGTARFNVGMYF
jgi:hypothetical protein